jgi:hypothetical protein
MGALSDIQRGRQCSDRRLNSVLCQRQERCLPGDAVLWDHNFYLLCFHLFELGGVPVKKVEKSSI